LKAVFKSHIKRFKEVSKLAKKYKVFKKSCILLFLQEQIKNMGKGDKKTKRGKIHKGTFGTRRPRIKKRQSAESKISISEKAKVK
jgi:30S ribosomal protein S31